MQLDYCPACDFLNAPDAIRCRACGLVLVTVSEGMRRIDPMYNVTSDDLAIASREFLIRWLSWNDRHGIYSDADRAAEQEEPLTLDDLREAALRQYDGGEA